MKLRHLFLSSMVIFFLLVVFSCATYPPLIDENFNRTYDASDVTDLNVINKTGNINISKWDEDEIRIKAVKKGWFKQHLDSVTILVKKGEAITVETRHSPMKYIVSVDYDIKVPANVDIEVKNITGDVTIKDIGSVSKVESVTGNVTIANVTKVRQFLVNTGNIKLDILQEKPEVNARTITGNITAHIASEKPRIITKVSTGNARNHNLETGSNGKVELTTETGNIDIYKK